MDGAHLSLASTGLPFLPFFPFVLFSLLEPSSELGLCFHEALRLWAIASATDPRFRRHIFAFQANSELSVATAYQYIRPLVSVLANYHYYSCMAVQLLPTLVLHCHCPSPATLFFFSSLSFLLSIPLPAPRAGIAFPFPRGNSSNPSAPA
jgi:hypothetical protein